MTKVAPREWQKTLPGKGREGHCFVCFAVCWLVGWLVGWSVGCVLGWLRRFSNGSVFDRLAINDVGLEACCVVVCLIGCCVDRFHG